MQVQAQHATVFHFVRRSKYQVGIQVCLEPRVSFWNKSCLVQVKPLIERIKVGAQHAAPLPVTARPWFLVQGYGWPLTQIVLTALDMAVAVGAVGTGGVIPDGSANCRSAQGGLL